MRIDRDGLEIFINEFVDRYPECGYTGFGIDGSDVLLEGTNTEDEEKYIRVVFDEELKVIGFYVMSCNYDSEIQTIYDARFVVELADFFENEKK